MGNLLMRWVYGLRTNNNVRLLTAYVLTLLLFLLALLTGGFHQPLMDFRNRVPEPGYSEARQIARNIDRGFGAKADDQLTQEQRRVGNQLSWWQRIGHGLATIFVSPLRWLRKYIFVWGFLLMLFISIVYTPIALRDEFFDLFRRFRQHQEAEATTRQAAGQGVAGVVAGATATAGRALAGGGQQVGQQQQRGSHGSDSGHIAFWLIILEWLREIFFERRRRQ